MATFLDAVGTLEEFSVIFTFILILSLVYALLQYTKMLGESKAIHMSIAMAISILFLFSQTATEIIRTIIPWFVVLFTGLLFLIMSIKMFGGGGTMDIDFWTLIKEHNTIAMWVMAISLIIILGATASVFSKEGRLFSPDRNVDTASSVSRTGDAGTTGPEGFWGTITHPNVLGLIALLLISSFTIRFLSKSSA